MIANLLVIEDELQMQKFLRASLTGAGYLVTFASTAAEGESLAHANNPDLVVLDLGLPDRDGLDVIKTLRSWMKAPIVIISARGQEDDKVVALDAGADDYLTKPFGTKELLARIRVALRHHTRDGATAPTLEAGELKIDLDKRRVFVAGREIHLTPIEYKLFALLMKHAGKVLTHRQILKEVWGPGYATQTHYLRVYMVQLRHKLEKDPAQPRYLITEPGVGYRLKAEDA
jgi:two-component system KDP operon response regulator KdpE